MKASSYLPLAYLCVSYLFVMQAHAKTIHFEDASLGKLDPSQWSETYLGESDQRLLYKVTDSVGYNDSRGLSFDAATAASSYRLVNQTPLTGNELTVSARFQLEIDENASEKPNHPLFGVFFCTSNKWFTGKRVDLMLLRRTNKEQAIGHYGLTSIVSQGVPVSWIEPSKIGLPSNKLSASDTATSDWFTLSLTLKSAGNGLWDMYCYIFDDNGDSIEALGAKGVALDAEFKQGKPVFGGITTGWSEGNDYRILDKAGIKSLYVDDFEVTTTP